MKKEIPYINKYWKLFMRFMRAYYISDIRTIDMTNIPWSTLPHTLVFTIMNNPNNGRLWDTCLTANEEWSRLIAPILADDLMAYLTTVHQAQYPHPKITKIAIMDYIHRGHVGRFLTEQRMNLKKRDAELNGKSFMKWLWKENSPSSSIFINLTNNTIEYKNT